MSRSLVALTLSIGLLGTAPATAGPIDGKLAQEGLGIEIGAILQGGHTEFASNNLGLSPSSQGLILRDRNGMSARMVIGLLIAVAGAMAASGPKSVESHSYVSGDYVVTETTTTYYSEEEKAQMRESNSKAVAGVFSTKFSDMELQLYSKDRFGFGDSSGYKLNFYIGSGNKVAFESGFGFGVVDSIVNDQGTPTKLTYKYLGMPFRISGVYKQLRLGLTYEWNFLKYGISDAQRNINLDAMGMNPSARVTSHPWHLDASTIIMGRVSVMGGLTAQEISKPKVGYYLSAGVMF